jgi:hypothetical protein
MKKSMSLNMDINAIESIAKLTDDCVSKAHHQSRSVLLRIKYLAYIMYIMSLQIDQTPDSGNLTFKDFLIEILPLLGKDLQFPD